MYTEKDLGNLSLNGMTDLDEENQEKSLRWLLEMDLSEPEEQLFKVSGNDYVDAGLSAYEAEVAARPLIRGNAHSDDLASYVEEEIVISSAGAASDIYGRKEQSDKQEPPTARRESVMAIDFSRTRNDSDITVAAEVDEGADILGLAGDDDIGEKYISIKRVKATSVNGTASYLSGTVKDAGGEAVDGEQADEAVSILGGAGASTGAGESDDAPDGIIELNDVPVPTRVAASVSDSVANESGVNYASVLDYVASIPQPLDDEEFDNYLLAGEHLLDAGSDLEELTVERTEGVIALDPYTDTVIDYHEDFHAMDGFGRDSASTIAAIITPVMEEISSAVRMRMEALGLDASAIAVEVRLGNDEASIKRCYAQGFEPVSAICFEMPEPLHSIDQAARDSIYVRLMNVSLQANWNDLFSLDFEPSGKSGSAADGDIQGAATADWSLDEGFGEDIFGDDFAEDFAAQLSNSGNVAAADIEAAFADLSHNQDDGGDTLGAGLDDFDKGDRSEHSAASREMGVTESAMQTEARSGLLVQEPVADEADALQETDLAAFDGTRVDGFVPDYIEFSYTSQSNAEIFADFLDAFIEEGSAEVEKLETEVGEWEKNVANEPLFAKVSRTLHTIKGIAKGVGLQRLGTLVHNFETLLDKMPRPAAGEEQSYFRIVNAWLDAVVRGVEHVADKRVDVASELPVQGEVPEQPVQQVAVAVESGRVETKRSEVRTAGEDAQYEPIESTAAVASSLEKKRDQQLADEGAKVLAAQQSVRITSEKLDHLLNLTAQAQQLGVRASQNTSRSKRSSAELQARLSSVRTHIRKIADRALLNVNARPGSSNPDLDALEMDQYSELQEAASILREGVEDLADLVDVVSRQNLQIETLLKQQSSVISSISSSIQGARVVPVSRLMPGLRRIVRTVSTDLGKIVSFKVLNETGALDRDHYARLQVMLEHMVRNALDHGIESPDERVAMGKPTGGRITIDVRKSGGDYLIRLSDDGRGIDPDAIRASAYQKGLKVDVDALTDEEAIRLIFHKGFSTASTLSEISGRGVGMDIVLTELQQIGGDVHIQSAVGLGTAFEIRIPSNVSVNGALLVAAAGESYAIPLNGLVGVEQVPVDEFFDALEHHTTLTIGGNQCEPTYLATLCQGISLPDRSAWGKFIPVIIAGCADRHMAIAIDKLEEALELVVRSLGSQFSSVPGVAGAATTAEGEAIVALDLNLLVNSAGPDGVAPVAVDQPKNTTLLALVVDDSRTQRMVATSQLDTVGVETVTAENGLVAIDLLNATHRLPDIILLDVEMPVKDGIQTLREIRKSRRYGHLPVIMVTSRTGAKHRALASEAGCNAYMGKPFSFPALVKQINALTGYDLQLS